MKKILFTLSIMLTMTVSVKAQQNSGQLKIYVANKATVINYIDTDYKGKINKGHLLAEVAEVAGDYSQNTATVKGNTYLFEVESGTETERFSVPKADVDVKTYDITPLPVSMIGKGLNFVSKDGLKARVFKSNLNGHKYEGTSFAQQLGINLNSCYVLSIECIDYYGSKVFVENPIGVKNGSILSDAFFPIIWASGKGSEKSSYDQAGRLLYNQVTVDGENIVVAYIGSEKALYYNNKLYYLTEAATNAPEPTASTPATPQSLDDLPLDEIFKLVEQKVSAKNLLAGQQYKFVGTFSGSGGYQMTWCRNCTCNKQGNVLSFQKGNSSVIGISEGMGSGGATLSLEVFNTNARDAVFDALNKMGFKIDSSISDAANQTMAELGIQNEQDNGWTTFSRETESWGQVADVKKSKKGWLFTVWPIAADPE